MKSYLEDQKESMLELFISNDNINNMTQLSDKSSVRKHPKNENTIESNLNQNVYCKKKRVPIKREIKEPSKKENSQKTLYENEIELNTQSLIETNIDQSNGLISAQNINDDIMNSFFIFRGHLLRDLRHIKLYNTTSLK